MKVKVLDIEEVSGISKKTEKPYKFLKMRLFSEEQSDAFNCVVFDYILTPSKGSELELYYEATLRFGEIKPNLTFKLV